MENKKLQPDEIEIDLLGMLSHIWHWMWVIALSAVIAGTVAFLISRYVIIDQYESTTKVYILSKQDNGTVTYSDVQMGTQLTKDYAQLITSRYVLEQVIASCGLTEDYQFLLKKVSVVTPTDTRIISITVTDEDPYTAQMLANSVREAASVHITNVMNIESVNAVENANLPESPSSPSVVKWTLIGSLLGVFLAVAIIVVRFMLDDTVKTSEDIENYLGLSTLALIPLSEEISKKNVKRNKPRHVHPEGIPEISDEDTEIII